MDGFVEPPTAASLAEARCVLGATEASVAAVEAEVEAAEAALAAVVKRARAGIEELVLRREELVERTKATLGYLSPMRRLPVELLRRVFGECFEAHPCCPWVLAAVCSSWRRLVLGMPRLWSRIRLVTTQHASPDTIRLWLHRAGNVVPLDIEIFLRVPALPAPRPSTPPSRSPTPLSWHIPAPYVPPPQSRSSPHWGHIAMFYLVQQIHRWQRFIFRFDRQFPSMSALKSITGDAPLLREFEVSSAEAAYYPDWQWLPNAPSPSAALPRLRTLTLQYTPFKWSSPIFRTNLHSLNLRALPTCHLPLDRILHIISANPALHSLSLHFHAVLPPVLPLSPTTLPNLHTLHITGHPSLLALIDSLALPHLHSLTLSLDPRDPLAPSLLALLARSSNPALTHLALGHSPPPSPPSSAFFYPPPGPPVPWPALLAALPALASLQAGATPLEPLLAALVDQPWACPALETLALRGSHSFVDGVARLVALVDARNPLHPLPHQGGVKRLRTLELNECPSVGEDVLAWLRARVHDVVCVRRHAELESMSELVWGV